MSLSEYYENIEMIQLLNMSIKHSCCYKSRLCTVEKFMEIFRKLVTEKYNILLKNEIYEKRIKSLNEEEQKLIEMRYVSKLSLTDIGNKLNIHVVYVRRKLERISKKLHMEL